MRHQSRPVKRWKVVALLAAGIALGATMTAVPVTAHVTSSLPHLIKHLKKTFFTKKAANKRFYTKKQTNGKLAKYYTKADVDTKLGDYYTKATVDTKLGDYYTKATVDTKLGDYYTKADVDAKLRGDFTIGIENAIVNPCTSGTLAVGIVNGTGAAADHRFTFQVPGTSEAYGQIRKDGSVRNGSANVASVTHTADSGVYCVVFTAAPTSAQLESSVVSLHYYSG